MTATDWIIDIALVLIVFRQLREGRLTARTILLPVVLMSWAGFNYLHSLPTAGNDLVLIGLLTAVGVAFGLVGGLVTRVRYREGSVYIKATASAAALWVISMGFRMAFAIWAASSDGARHLTSFSIAHHITSDQAWVAALILMAFGEVVVRLGVIIARGQLASARNGQRAAGRPAPMAQARS